MSSALQNPHLNDCRCLFLRNFKTVMNIGVYEHEKNGGQRVLFNVELYVPLAVSTPSHDRLDEVVDYDLIRDTIRHLTRQEHVHLLETLCDEIAHALLSNQRVRAVRVEAAKLDVYPDSESVGVEIFQWNPGYMPNLNKAGSST